MKKKITIVFIIISFIMIAITKNSFASSTFKVSFEQGYSAKAGETIEIPVILSDINVDGKQKGIVDFSGYINLDNVFEIVRGENGYFSLNEDIAGDMQVGFYPDNNKIVFNISEQFYSNKANSLKSYVEIGTMQIKVKENTKAGDYNLKIQNIVGENAETSVKVADTSTKVRVIEEQTTKDDDDDNPEASKKVTSKTMYFWEQGEAKLYITQNETGTQVIIVPDEENGTKIGKIIVNGEEIERVDGKYVINTEYGDTLDIIVYGEDGKLLMNKTYIVINDNVYENNFDSVGEESSNTSTSAVHSAKTNAPSKDTEDASKEEANKETDSPKASPQTGDLIFVTVAILILASAVLTATQIIKRRI